MAEDVASLQLRFTTDLSTVRQGLRDIEQTPLQVKARLDTGEGAPARSAGAVAPAFRDRGRVPYGGNDPGEAARSDDRIANVTSNDTARRLMAAAQARSSAPAPVARRRTTETYDLADPNQVEERTGRPTPYSVLDESPTPRLRPGVSAGRGGRPPRIRASIAAAPPPGDNPSFAQLDRAAFDADREDDEDEKQSKGGGRGGRGRSIVGRGFGRFASGAFVAREVFNAANATRQYNIDHILAGTDQRAELDATLTYRDKLLSIPILGDLIKYASDPGGLEEAGIRATRSYADAQDAFSSARTASGAFLRAGAREATVAATPRGFLRGGAEIDAKLSGDLAENQKQKQELQAFATKQSQEELKLAQVTLRSRADYDENDPTYSRYNAPDLDPGEEATRDEARAALKRVQDAKEAAAEQSRRINLTFGQADDDARKRADAARHDLNTDRQQTISDFGTDAFAARLRGTGATDAAALAQLRGKNLATETAILRGGADGTVDTALFNATEIADDAAEKALVAQQGRAAGVRAIRRGAGGVSDIALSRRNPAASRIADFLGENEADSEEAQPDERPGVRRRNAAKGVRVITELYRDLSEAADDAESSAAGAGLRARGDTFGAARLNAINVRDKALRELPQATGNASLDAITDLLGVGPNSPNAVRRRGAINATADANISAINRAQGFGLLGLSNEIQSTGLQAQGKPIQAEITGVALGAQLRAAQAGNPLESALQASLGLQQLRAIEYQQQHAGSAQEVAAGSLGPGFRNNDENPTDVQAMLDAYEKALKDTMVKPLTDLLTFFTGTP